MFEALQDKNSLLYNVEEKIMNKRRILGNAGEAEVEQYLMKNKYKILDRNFQCNLGEIDIIALDKNKEIVFIEVKTRNIILYGYPAEAVTGKKLQHIYNTAKYYLHVRNLGNDPVRIDVIEVYIQHNCYKINHIKQVI